MKWYHYIFCFVIIMLGLYSCFELYNIFSVSSMDVGTYESIETVNEYTDVSKFDYGFIDFDTEDYVTFTDVTAFEPIQFDGSKNNYVLLFNGEPVSETTLTSGKISGTFNLAFYDLNGDKITTANLDILIEYFASQTKVTMTIVNTNDSIAYLNTYMNLNGAILKVVERGAV